MHATDPVRPVVLGAVADDAHAPHVVETVERLAQLHELRPVYVHVPGHNVAAPIAACVGTPYEEPRVPELTDAQAEDAFAAWRAAKPVFARAGVQDGRDARVVGGAPPAIELRDLARTLQAQALVVGRGTHSSRILRMLAGSTALALARCAPTRVLFVDDQPLPLPIGPVVCVLDAVDEGWDVPLHAAARFADRSGRALSVYATARHHAMANRHPVIEATPLAADGDPAHHIATLAERTQAGLLVVGQEQTPALRALVHGSLPIDLLNRPVPLMSCPLPG